MKTKRQTLAFAIVGVAIAGIVATQPLLAHHSG